MGKQAKARRRREGWGCTSKRFRPVTARDPPPPNAADSDSDEEGAPSHKPKRKPTETPVCPKAKRRKERHARELKLFVGKRGVAAKRDDAAAAKGTAAHTLPPIDWTCEPTVAFKRVFWPASAEWSREDAVVPTECKLARKRLGIVVRGTSVPPPITSLDDLRLPKHMRVFLKRATKFSEPTAVQAQAWPAALSGANLVAVAPTGTGKTLAFMLPAVPHCLARPEPLKIGEGPVVLVVEPTRELAAQIESVCIKFAPLFSLRCVSLYGGVSKEHQVDRLLAPTHIVVATPGRLIDVVRAGDMNLRAVTYFVLDEADRLLALGFREQVDTIAQQIRPDAQRLLFSATAPAAVQEVVEAWMKDPAVIKARPVPTTSAVVPVSDRPGRARHDVDEAVAEATVGLLAEEEEAGEAAVVAQPEAASGVKQLVQVTAPHKKPRKLMKLLESIDADAAKEAARGKPQVLVFANKIKTVAFVGEFLRKHKRRATELHSQLPQAARTATLDGFRSGKAQILIATDVAARGIDIKNLKWVVNYDMPGNLEQYVHRIGRVGRAGASGTAVTFFTRNMAPLGPGLIRMLESGGHPVDRYLVQLVAEAKVETETGEGSATVDALDSD